MIGKRKYIRMRRRKDPTLNPKRLASCEGKIRWSKDDRERALQGKPSSVKFYRCIFCPHYHIGKRKEGTKHGRK